MYGNTNARTYIHEIKDAQEKSASKAKGEHSEFKGPQGTIILVKYITSKKDECDYMPCTKLLQKVKYFLTYFGWQETSNVFWTLHGEINSYIWLAYGLSIS